ncbi:hypothetical protein DYBT9275_02442 [Dyadobacter sp. CECT 9275]|uniref:NodB homology domain-containing protein n=1 Tax=Dyadobacter helix TaxID=2822344 RepID=A0A916JAU1_9BACT|nr:polysaccharide deacetylase family protein [Dyadobacter sp. CECT 9275]CAG5000335.1 hypothetical protein DYBT9275_02442 [Dyadobacter sp. CECT 9275]
MQSCKSTAFLFLIALSLLRSEITIAQKETFKWPEGKKTAISLSFDDARGSQATKGIPFLDQYNVKGTFYLVPSAAEKQLTGWKKAVASGHEIGNHSVNHPCSGNFAWARPNALEGYTLEKMKAELIDANNQIERMLGVKPEVFAYPCGGTFVGRGVNTKSYIPVVAELFLTGRGWLDEGPNDPAFCDFAQLTGMEMDGKDFEQILPLIQQARSGGQWLVLAGHEMGESGGQTTRLSMLKKLIEYAQDPANGIWLAPVGTVAKYIQTAKDEKKEVAVNKPETVRAAADGTYSLSAASGKATGPKIQFMPEWNAFGWFTAADRVEWDMDVSKGGTFDVTLEWSVSDEEAGKPFVLETGKSVIKGKTEKSGSWETFKSRQIGQIKLSPGKHKMVFRPDSKFEKGALLDLRGIKLSPAGK